MFLRISRILVLALIATTAIAEEPKCTASARDCDQQIRQMLSGRRFLGVTIEERGDSGLVVKSVVPNSPAYRSGLRAGDRLIAVNGKSLTQSTTREFKQIIADARETGRLWVIIWRRGAYSRVETRLEPYSKEQINKIISAHVAQSHTSSAGVQ